MGNINLYAGTSYKKSQNSSSNPPLNFPFQRNHVNLSFSGEAPSKEDIEFYCKRLDYFKKHQGLDNPIKPDVKPKHGHNHSHKHETGHGLELCQINTQVQEQKVGHKLALYSSPKLKNEHENEHEEHSHCDHDCHEEESRIAKIKDSIHNVKSKLHKQNKPLGTDAAYTFKKLKASEVIVVGGVKPKIQDYLDKDKFNQIKKIYLDITSRPELYESCKYEIDEHKMRVLMCSYDVNDKTREFKHIIADILPEVLEDQTFVTDDPADLNKLLSDKVVQEIILDKLCEEEILKKQDKIIQPDKDKVRQTVENRYKEALNTVDDIRSKFDITFVSKIPEHSSCVLKKEKNTPKENYDKKLLGLKHEPQNYYEAKFLDKAVTNKIDGYDPENTIIVKPKGAAKDVIERIKEMNQEYILLEDWLYKYCMGNRNEKEEVLDLLNKSTENKFRDKFQDSANFIDNYLDNYIKVYDINKPENNEKLSNLMKDYGKVACMTDISKGYFLGIAEDTKHLITTFISIGLAIEIFEKLSDASGIKHIKNAGNFIGGSIDNFFSAGGNYLQWKNQYGEEIAKEKLQLQLKQMLPISLLALLPDLSPGSGMLSLWLFRNASAADAYTGVLNNLNIYSKNIEKLMKNELKNPPEDIKDDPQKVHLWRVTEAFRHLLSPSLYKGQVWGIIASQPYALAGKLSTGPLRVSIIALAGMLECVVTNACVLSDSAAWNRLSNNIKKSMVENNNTSITPQEFMKKKESILVKVLESNQGQYVLNKGIKASDKIPSKYSDKFLEYYYKLGGLLSRPIANFMIKILNNMSEKDREKFCCSCHSR